MPTTAGEEGREPMLELVGIAEPLEPRPVQATSAPASRAQAANFTKPRVPSPVM